MATTAAGRAVSLIAVAAGVTRSAKISNTPTTVTEIAITRLMQIKKMVLNARTGIPFAAATSGSIEQNISCRPVITIAISTITVITPKITS